MAAHTHGVLIAEADPVRFAAAFFAAVYLRKPVVLANRRWGSREWGEVAAQVNPAVVFGSAPGLRTSRRRGLPPLAASTMLIPTGGSSGGVRFAVHRWETLMAAAAGLIRFMGGGSINHGCVLPLFHVSGLMQLIRAHASGGWIAFPAFSDLQVGKFPRFGREEICLSLVGTQLQRLMKLKRAVRGLASCRALFLGGGPVAESVLAQARELKLPVFLSYGMTETAAMVAALPPDEFLDGATSAGRSLPHLRLSIRAADGTECAPNVAGRIWVAGTSLFKGYHGQRRLDLSKGFRTGDEGFLDGEGRLHVLGRSDRLIISGGEKVDPKEVEDAILETGAVDQVLVIGWPDPEWGQRLVALYVEAGIQSNNAAWAEELRNELANYKLPKLMVPVEQLPLNAHGKIDRRLVDALVRKALRG